MVKNLEEAKIIAGKSEVSKVRLEDLKSASYVKTLRDTNPEVLKNIVEAALIGHAFGKNRRLRFDSVDAAVESFRDEYLP